MNIAETWRSYGYEPNRNPRYKNPIEKGIAWEACRQWCYAVSRDCYTCPARDLIPGVNLNAGHYKPVALVGSGNKYSWDERFIRSQCSRCNGAGAGMAYEFGRNLRKEIGDEAVEEFELNYRKSFPIKNWSAIIRHYQELKAAL